MNAGHVTFASPGDCDRRSALLLLLASGCAPSTVVAANPATHSLLTAARKQVGVTLHYDPAYTRLAFPGGDVPRAKGVCTDVIIRAYRDAFKVDLQLLVHDDMRKNFAAYPHIWGLARPDPNIDHRRVPNLQTFFARSGARLPLPRSPQGWRPGDIFTSMVDGRLTHIGFVSDRKASNGHPLIIHNIGAGAREEDALFAYPLSGRFRFRV